MPCHIKAYWVFQSDERPVENATLKELRILNVPAKGVRSSGKNSPRPDSESDPPPIITNKKIDSDPVSLNRPLVHN
tara:strand:- start:223 stop:450 length:228 start_codon:yes stop_codon:yes gene_type:complete